MTSAAGGGRIAGLVCTLEGVVELMLCNQLPASVVVTKKRSSFFNNLLLQGTIMLISRFSYY